MSLLSPVGSRVLCGVEEGFHVGHLVPGCGKPTFERLSVTAIVSYAAIKAAAG